MSNAIQLLPAAPLPITVEPAAGLPVSIVVVNGIPGPPGAEGPAGLPGEPFDFTQGPPAAQWTIPHNLGRRPSVTTLSVGGVPMEGSVVHLSTNVLLVDFLVPVAGSAHLV